MLYQHHDHYQTPPPGQPKVWCDRCGLYHEALPEVPTLMMCVCGAIVVKFEDGCKYDQDPWQRHDHEIQQQAAPPVTLRIVEKPKEKPLGIMPKEPKAPRRVELE